jgi:hypothetical protein
MNYAPNPWVLSRMVTVSLIASEMWVKYGRWVYYDFDMSLKAPRGVMQAGDSMSLDEKTKQEIEMKAGGNRGPRKWA